MSAKHITAPLVRAYLADLLNDARVYFREARALTKLNRLEPARMARRSGETLQQEYRRLCAAPRVTLTRFGVPQAVDA